MKNNNRTLKVVLLSVVSVLLLTSMLLSVMMESTNAKLFKELRKKMSIEAVPDLPWEYYIKDSANSAGRVGAYKDNKNISQSITTSATAANTIYRIAIPVDQEGYYTLSFNVDFWKGTTDSSSEILVSNVCEETYDYTFSWNSYLEKIDMSLSKVARLSSCLMPDKVLL